MDMIQLAQKHRKFVDEARESDFWKGISDLLAHQYSNKTHFIFELLQNAEDAGATEVEFRVESHQLIFSHNGERLFSDENVESITNIGKSTKQTDYTQIGKHGIGFKAVFAYVHTPRIHSGDKHFDIEDFVVPCFLPGSDVPADLKPGETRFILPFDSDAIPEAKRFRELIPAETAKADISDALTKLNTRTLLFLRHIEEIRWTLVDGTKGAYLRESRSELNRTSLRHVDVTDGVKTESWLVFEQETNVTDDGKNNECIVEVAFLIENGKVIPARNTELAVYFSTKKKTGLAFLIQGPFKTTKARDDIKDDPANQRLLEVAAHLAADSIETLRDLKLLDVSSYLALPLQIPEDSFFHPVYERIREALRTKPLLPAYDGTFIKASEAKLARGKDLVELFSPEQLGNLCGKENLTWLDASITEGPAMSGLHTYLVGRKKYPHSKDWEIEPLWDGLLVDADTLVPKLTADFLGRQPLPWLVKFIQYAAQGASVLKRTPFVRLVSDKHKQVSLPVDAKTIRPAWFAPKDTEGLDLSVFPIVHPGLVANEDILKFLEKEGIREIDAVAIVEKSVLPKYQDINPGFDESTYRVDLRRIREAYGKANDAEKAQLITSLNKYGWLACINASGNAADKIVWKKPGASDLFDKTVDHENWFDGLEDVNAYFLHSSVIETLNGAITSLAKTTTVLTTNLSTNECTISLSNEYYGNHKQGLKGFNPKTTIVGIKSAWANWNQDRSKILWKALLSAPLKIISGETQSATNRQKLDKAHKKIEYTEVGELCRKNAWLPVNSENWSKPSELLLTDLPEGFESTSISAKELAAKLGMRQPEREQAMEVVTGGDAKLKMLIEHYQSSSDHEREKFLKIIPQEPSEPAPSFKDGLKNLGRPQKGVIEHGDIERSLVSDSGSYQDNLIERVETGVEEHQTNPRKITFSPVRNLPSNAEAHGILYEEYHGRCQVTGMTFPKASKNTNGMAENYFEACSLLSYANANYLNDAGNMLCVSADTMAKFKCASISFLDSLGDAIETFKANDGRAESISINIQLAGEECSIKWSQRHFMRLVALYEKA